MGYESGYPGDQAPLAQAGYRRAAMVHQPNSLDSVDGEPLPFDPVPVRFDAGESNHSIVLIRNTINFLTLKKNHLTNLCSLLLSDHDPNLMHRVEEKNQYF